VTGSSSSASEHPLKRNSWSTGVGSMQDGESIRRWSRSVFLSKDVISTGTEGIKEISFFPPCSTASTAKYKKFAQSVEKW